MAEVEADAVAELTLGREDGAGGNADALVEGHSVEFQRIDPLGQFEPHEIAASRPGEFGFGWKVAFDGFDKDRFLNRQMLPQAAQVVVVAAMLQIFGNGDLDRDGGGERGRQLEADNLFSVAPGRDPAETVAGGEAFGKGRDVHHVVVFGD